MSKRVIGYVRVSTDGQAETGYGLDVQRERIAAYATSQGIAIDEFIVDDGYSGTTIERPGLTRLIALCEACEVAKVIVYSIDRLARKQRLLLELIEDRFDGEGVGFVSVSQQFDTSTPFGRAMLGMLGVFAQLDRDQVVERLANGRKARAATGERAVGSVPYGYRSVEVNGRKTTVVDESEAAVVRRIFSLHNEGKTLQAICDAINASGARTKRGNTFTTSSVRDILNNRVYEGVVTYGKGGSSPIIATNDNLALV